jgi:hypothetical protein
MKFAAKQGWNYVQKEYLNKSLKLVSHKLKHLIKDFNFISGLIALLYYWGDSTIQ